MAKFEKYSHFWLRQIHKVLAQVGGNKTRRVGSCSKELLLRPTRVFHFRVLKLVKCPILCPEIQRCVKKDVASANEPSTFNSRGGANERRPNKRCTLMDSATANQRRRPGDVVIGTSPSLWWRLMTRRWIGDDSWVKETRFLTSRHFFCNLVKPRPQALSPPVPLILPLSVWRVPLESPERRPSLVELFPRL